jgi:hypothetical protein
MRYAAERRNLDESIEELRQIADGRDDILAEVGGLTARWIVCTRDSWVSRSSMQSWDKEEVKVEEDCVILDIPEGLRLNLLGLVVQIDRILITADRAGLLGGLLASLTCGGVGAADQLDALAQMVRARGIAPEEPAQGEEQAADEEPAQDEEPA